MDSNELIDKIYKEITIVRKKNIPVPSLSSFALIFVIVNVNSFDNEFINELNYQCIYFYFINF